MKALISSLCFCLYFPVVLTGCSIKSLSEQASPMLGDRAPAWSHGCVWLLANEIKEIRFIALPVSRDHSPLEDTVYLCCPGDQPNTPVCTSANWQRWTR